LDTYPNLLLGISENAIKCYLAVGDEIMALVDSYHPTYIHFQNKMIRQNQPKQNKTKQNTILPIHKHTFIVGMRYLAAPV
jgi:hypothetical protein